MTDVALRDYFDRRLEDLDRRVMDRFTLSDAAVSKAERTMNDRLNSMNEFRDALKDQAGRMATRSELERLEATVHELRRAQANFDGRMVVLTGSISAGVSLVLWAISLLVR